MFDAPTPRIFSIDSGTAFVDALAARLIEDAGGDPMTLAEMRVLLPTRRACRALADAFLRQGGGRTALLPRLMPLGDIDEDELAIFEAGQEPGAASAADLPAAIPGLKRQLLLTRAVMALPDHSMQPAQATALALELGKLIDRMATEDCDPGALATLVADDYAEHWQKVLRFLDIIITTWPDILALEGALDPAARRNALLRGQAQLWSETPPTTPVIAAGSTGSIPATADLLSVIAGLPQGAVILPGLDRDMPEDAWALLGPTHPQFGLKQLLLRLDVARDAVGTITAPANSDSQARGRILSSALAPASAPRAPLPDVATLRAGLVGVTRLDCPGPADEASAIALIMRRQLETPGKTCALVTPDRALARRVTAALGRWGVELDDSAGQPMASTPPGAFLRLVADCARERLAPVALLALLKHPLAAGGMAVPDFRDLVRGLEVAVLRGPRPAPGIKGLRALVDPDKKLARLRPLMDRIDKVMSPLMQMLRADDVIYTDVLSAHVASAEALAASDEEQGAQRLWAGDAGEAVARFVAELADSLPVLGGLEGAAYPGMLERLMDGRVVRPRFGAHPRLFIWGLLEARLQHADTVILGGLNEGTWPPAPETNPWMSRPMMTDMGLEAPERRIGLTAHDFQQALAAKEVIITRADRVGGAPTVPSRWLARLDNLFARAGLTNPLAPGVDEAWLSWATALDRAKHTPPPKPRPCPPISARPKELSVTQIGTLIRDPYAIYARHILGLRKLDPLDADPGASDRGNMVHDALEQFVRAYPDRLPEDAERRLVDIGRDVFAPLLARPGVQAFWWPRFQRIAHWFVDWQRGRLAEGWQVSLIEERGEYNIDSVVGGFKITAKPDRIDHQPGVGLAILDYKTGNPPTGPQVNSGLEPQLPLEAVMAYKEAFKDVPKDEVVQLMYVYVSGGREPGKANALKLDVTDVVERTLRGVSRLIVRFADEDTPYLSNPRPQFVGRFHDYDHLARVAAWRAGEGSEE